jgi:hypothetical protein
VPVALTNTPTNVVMKPSTAKRPRSAPTRPIFGIQVTSRMNTPRISSSQKVVSATNTRAPSPAPINEPMTNGRIAGRITLRHMIMVRVMPDPSITTVCTGMSASGGITIAISPSRTMPPAAPVNTPTNDATSDATVRPKKANGPMSGVPRKSIFLDGCLEKLLGSFVVEDQRRKHRVPRNAIPAGA